MINVVQRLIAQLRNQAVAYLCAHLLMVSGDDDVTVEEKAIKGNSRQYFSCLVNLIVTQQEGAVGHFQWVVQLVPASCLSDVTNLLVEIGGDPVPYRVLRKCLESFREFPSRFTVATNEIVILGIPSEVQRHEMTGKTTAEQKGTIRHEDGGCRCFRYGLLRLINIQFVAGQKCSGRGTNGQRHRRPIFSEGIIRPLIGFFWFEICQEHRAEDFVLKPPRCRVFQPITKDFELVNELVAISLRSTCEP